MRFLFICLFLWLKFVEWCWWGGGGGATFSVCCGESVEEPVGSCYPVCSLLVESAFCRRLGIICWCYVRRCCGGQSIKVWGGEGWHHPFPSHPCLIAWPDDCMIISVAAHPHGFTVVLPRLGVSPAGGLYMLWGVLLIKRKEKISWFKVTAILR